LLSGVLLDALKLKSKESYLKFVLFTVGGSKVSRLFNDVRSLFNVLSIQHNISYYQQICLVELFVVPVVGLTSYLELL
jgi:hypothetical protein